MAKLGIADQVKPKIKLLNESAPAAVAKGEVEIGLGPMSEVLLVPGVQLAGPFPTGLQSYLVFMGVSSVSKSADAARSLIKFLTAPAAVSSKTKTWSRDDQGHNHERRETAAMI